MARKINCFQCLRRKHRLQKKKQFIEMRTLTMKTNISFEGMRKTLSDVCRLCVVVIANRKWLVHKTSLMANNCEWNGKQSSVRKKDKSQKPKAKYENQSQIIRNPLTRTKESLKISISHRCFFATIQRRSNLNVRKKQCEEWQMDRTKLDSNCSANNF